MGPRTRAVRQRAGCCGGRRQPLHCWRNLQGIFREVLTLWMSQKSRRPPGASSISDLQAVTRFVEALVVPVDPQHRAHPRFNAQGHQHPDECLHTCARTRHSVHRDHKQDPLTGRGDCSRTSRRAELREDPPRPDPLRRRSASRRRGSSRRWRDRADRTRFGSTLPQRSVESRRSGEGRADAHPANPIDRAADRTAARPSTVPTASRHPVRTRRRTRHQQAIRRTRGLAPPRARGVGEASRPSTRRDAMRRA